MSEMKNYLTVVEADGSARSAPISEELARQVSELLHTSDLFRSQPQMEGVRCINFILGDISQKDVRDSLRFLIKHIEVIATVRVR